MVAESGSGLEARNSWVLVAAALLVLGSVCGCVSRADEGSPGPQGDDGDSGDGDGSPSSDGGAISCLSVGTRVTTPDGARRIEELAVGDLVVSLDHDTGMVRHNPITAIRRAHRPVGEVRFPGGRLLATAEHPFFDASTGRYVESASIGGETALVALPYPGAPSLLRTAAALDSFLAEPYQPHLAEADVYDLTVARDHNYFAEGVLVHNKTLIGGSPEYFCSGVAAATLEVCSGPAEAGPAPTAGSTPWSVYATASAPGMAGASGEDDGVAAEDTIVVSFLGCYGIAGYNLFVAPGQVVELGASSGPCAAAATSFVTADETGRLFAPVPFNSDYGGGTGYVQVAIPAAEFECLYLAGGSEPGLCDP